MPAARCATFTDLDNDHLLFVATDRISAFDYVLATGIPHKGRVLTQLSLFWFEFLKDIVPNHLVTADVSQYPAEAAEVCRPAARTLHAGAARGDVPGGMRGARLSLRLRLEGIQSNAARSAESSCPRDCANPTNCPSRSSRRPPRQPPATTRTFRSSEMVKLVGSARLSEQLARSEPEHLQEGRRLCAAKGHHHCRHQVRVRTHRRRHHAGRRSAHAGLLALLAGRQVPAGHVAASFDKQYVRDYLEEIRWNKQPPAPALPPRWRARPARNMLRRIAS